jgi:hypothetical protein
MRRVAFPALALLMSLAGRMLSAQAPDPTGTVLRIGVGADKMDITCGECQIDAERGISAFIAASRPIGGGFTAGLEASFANAAFETNTVSEDTPGSGVRWRRRGCEGARGCRSGGRSGSDGCCTAASGRTRAAPRSHCAPGAIWGSDPSGS